MNLCVNLFYYLPVKNNKIVMLHDFGLGYGDSPKYIAEELLKEKNKLDIVWLINNWSLHIPCPIRKAHLSRIRSVYELATAKIIITTNKGRFNLKKKNEQYVVYIPHGQSGAKYVEKAAKGLGQSYIDNSKWHSSICDLFLSSSKIQTQEMRDYFWYDGEIVEYGLPRNDIFFHYTDEDIYHIREKINVKKDDFVCLYAPTFRNEGDLSVYDIDKEKILTALENKMKKKCRLLLRSHPNYIWYGKPLLCKDNDIIDVTDYPDMQELLLASDLLITDYSSTMFDFMLMKRPIFIYAKDIEEYEKMRGLKDWFHKVPFPICKNNEELTNSIINFDETKYKTDVIKFNLNIYGSIEQGNATNILCKHLKQIMTHPNT